MLSVVVANCLSKHMTKSILITIVMAAKPMKGISALNRERRLVAVTFDPDLTIRVLPKTDQYYSSRIISGLMQAVR